MARLRSNGYECANGWEQKILRPARRVIPGWLGMFWLLSSLAWGQQPASDWQAEIRRYAEARDWAAAMRVVDHELARAPRDMDVRAWHARLLAWSGRFAEAEHEYGEILKAAPDDPDHWMGLANVCAAEGRPEDALRALERAIEIDPKRADFRVARGRSLRDAGARDSARLEFEQALALDPNNAEARTGQLSLRGEPRHELRFGLDHDAFNFTGARREEWVSLVSRWTPHWTTSAAESFYQRGGMDAREFAGSVTGRLPRWGSLTAGGTTAHDSTVIPKSGAFFEYGRGWRVRERGFIRGVEAAYGQHWYWYSTARILTVNGTVVVNLPREWTWSFGLTGARSQFSGTQAEWRPSGATRLGFPIVGRGERRLGGNMFCAVGTENFGNVDQIGQFSSHTYGGGLRFQWTARQDVTGYAAYQRRTQDRTQTSFGFTYGIRF
jgi:tetratricopeptide (TPR) repeat protein